MIQQVLFILITLIAVSGAYFQFNRIRRTIKLGKPECIKGHIRQRWQNVLFVALGQKKMFKQWGPALFHFFIYAAFLITQIELIEILVDGITGQHRVFARPLGSFYTFVINSIEILSVLALFATLYFLARRTIVKSSRFQQAEMRGWPSKDGILILVGEILLIAGILSMNSADVLLQHLAPDHYPETGTLLISGFLGPLLWADLSQQTLAVIERSGWWLHILTVYCFLNYLPVSKHLHILLAFPNAYYSRLRPRGEMENMPDIMNEVKSMMGFEESEEVDPSVNEELPEFGAKDIFDLSWKTLLDAYTCTECGRCTQACPANLTGKKLSPRKIMMDIRDRAEEVSQSMASMPAPSQAAQYEDGKSLFDSISPEEIHACTACQACVEACPVLINPLDPILAMRRYEVLTESSGPSDWIPMFNSIENNGAVWQVGEPRDAWTKG